MTSPTENQNLSSGYHATVGEPGATRPTGSPDAALPSRDPSGPFVRWGSLSVWTIGLYLLLAVLLFALSGDLSSPSITAVLALLVLFFLFRYVSTHYVLDPESLRARRLVGSRKVRFEDIRKIERASLRDLGPVGVFGTWGWRGRVWSPIIGDFDTIHTASSGLLVSAGRFPLFISPKDPEEFARELSRRARSWGVRLDVDPPALAHPTGAGSPGGP